MTDPIDKDSRVPLYKQVKDYLLDYIEKRPAGTDRIPPEVEISKQFGISRATVRTAVLDLVNEGYLERIPGKGTYIQPKTNTLVFTNWLTLEEYSAGSINALIEEYQQEVPGVEIENLGIPYLQTEHQLMLMATGGKAPDIAALIYLWIPIFAHQGALHPLDEVCGTEITNNIFPQTLDAVSYQGHVYGFNWINAPNILFYNKRILAEYTGSEDCSVDYYDELVELFAKIHEGSHGEIIPYALPVLDDEQFFLYTLYNYLHSFHGGVINPQGEMIFNSEENIRAFNWLKSFIKKGHINISRGHIENRRLFAQNRIAFYLEGPWLRYIVPTLNREYHQDIDNIGFRTLPKTPNNGSSSVLWNHTLSVFRQCKNKKLAVELIKYITQNKEVCQRYYLETGMLPVRLDELQTNPVYNDTFGQVLKQQMETAFAIPAAHHPSFMLSIILCARAAREILIGDADAAATLNHFAGLINEFYKR